MASCRWMPGGLYEEVTKTVGSIPDMIIVKMSAFTRGL